MVEATSALRRTQPLSLGIIGAGEIVTHVHLPVLSACEGVRFVYIADINADAVKRATKSFGGMPVTLTGDPGVLPESDVVLLAVPVAVRMPYFELFARRGTCVLAEKPLAASLADATRVCDLFPDYALGCGFQRRGYATVRLAQAIVAEGWLGPLRSITIEEGALTTKTGTDARFYDAGGNGGVLMDLGSHTLDLALRTSGAIKATVIDQHLMFDGDIDREVQAHLLLHTPSGECELEYLVTWLRSAENVIRLRFDNCVASLSCRPSEHIEIHGLRDARQTARWLATDGATTVYQAFYLEWMTFLDGVRGRQASAYSARSALDAVAAVDALYQAARQPQ